MKNIMKGGCLVFVCMLLLFSSAAWAERPIRILVIEPLSGPMKDNGDRTVLGVQFAAEEANAQGGVLGRKIEVIGEDSQMKPDTAARKAQKYLLEDSVDVIIAGSGTAVSNALKEVAKDHDVLVIDEALGILDPTGKDFSYQTIRLTYNFPMFARAIVYYFAQNKEFKRFYLLNPDNAAGWNIAGSFKKEIARQIPGGQVVGEDFHPYFTMDFSPLLSKIAASNADAILTASWGSDITIVTKQRKELGVRAILASYALADWPKVRANPTAALGNVALADYMVTANTKENADFKSRWTKKYKDQPWFEPDPLTFRAYLAIAFVLEGVKKAKSIQVNKLMPVLEGMHFRNPMGDMYLRACDHQASLPIGVAPIVSTSYPYYGVPMIIPASAAAIEESETGNPRCSKK